MAYTFYDASIGVAKDALASLSTIIDKVESSSVAAAVPAGRIHPDMLPFKFQVYMVTTTIHKLVARTTGSEPKEYENNHETLEAMKTLIAEIQAQVESADRDTINSRETEIVSVGMGKGKPDAKMQSWQYAHGWAVPNVYFHLVTAYDIARKEGVEVGKFDFLGAFMGKFIQPS